MAKRIVVICTCTWVLMLGVFTFGKKTISERVRASVPRPERPLEAQSQSAPDHVVYGLMFARVVRLREKTREEQTKGHAVSNGYIPLQKEAELTPGQATALEAIAHSCQQRVRQQDERAKLIVTSFRSQFVDGRIPPGGAPPPPPELKVMWQERIDTILRARDQLREVLGQQEFTRLDNYVKFHYGTNTSPVTIRDVETMRKHNRLLVHSQTERTSR